MDLTQIENIYLYSANKYEELYKYFFHYCGFQILESTISLGFDTFRIRDYKNLNEIVNHSSVKYPPFSKTYSRIGKPNQIWFYVSDDIEAAIAEMLPSWHYRMKPGEDVNIVISKWHIREMIKVLIIPDLTNTNEFCKNLNLDIYKRDAEFWKYICTKFRSTTLDSKDIYVFTSAFANALINRAKMEGKSVDGIFYPSVQHPLKSNVALLKSVVDDSKVVLKSLFKTVFHKSPLLNRNGKYVYKQISNYEQGYYEPNKDEIEWTN